MDEPTPANAPSKRSSAIVVPRRLKWHHHCLAWLLATGFRALAATWRCRFIDHSQDVQPRAPVIFALWHNRLALCMTIWHSHVIKKRPANGLAALISASKDGGLLARTLEYFDVEAVRGSSSRRGGQAMLELTTHTDNGRNVAITPDGPRGPCYAVQDGIISLAQVSGLPIQPVSAHVRGKLTLGSWDKFQVPLPFARCDIFFGELLVVPRDATADQRAEIKRELQRRLMALTRD